MTSCVRVSQQDIWLPSACALIGGEKHCMAFHRNWPSLICRTPQPHRSHPIGYVFCVLLVDWISTCASSVWKQMLHKAEMTNFMAVLHNRRRGFLCEGRLGLYNGWLYVRLDSECHGRFTIITWGKKGAWGARQLIAMKRQRTWEDGELLTSNTEDNTDQSEHDESSSLRSPWSLVSQGWGVDESVRSERSLPCESTLTTTLFLPIVARLGWVLPNLDDSCGNVFFLSVFSPLRNIFFFDIGWSKLYWPLSPYCLLYILPV